jgi:hypothetical protein
VTATSARAEVHEPPCQPPNLTESREAVEHHIKTAPLIPLLLDKQTVTETSVLEPHKSESPVFTSTSRLRAWLEESDNFENQATGLQRRHTTPTSSQFVWSKRLQPGASPLTYNDRENPNNSLSESDGTCRRASGNTTTNSRGLSRWHRGSQSLQEPTTPVEVQALFLKSILESGIPLIPEAKLEIEAEAEAAPQRPAVTWATLPRRPHRPRARMEGRLQVRQPEMSGHKAKAVDDARQAQAAVNEMCRLAGRPPPRWALCELIGKGSYGRVYMG